MLSSNLTKKLCVTSLAVVIAGVFLVVRDLKYKVPKVHLTMPKGYKGCGAP